MYGLIRVNTRVCGLTTPSQDKEEPIGLMENSTMANGTITVSMARECTLGSMEDNTREITKMTFAMAQGFTSFQTVPSTMANGIKAKDTEKEARSPQMAS